MGLGKDRKSFDATILYQMTKENIDFKVSDRDENRRLFKGDSDVIILKLNGNSGGAYKRVNAMTPEEFSDGIDLNLGKKIVCYGSPAYKTDKIYGQCKGSDFYWRQYARAFENNTTPQQSGLETNLAAGPGMSGGPCMFIEDTNTIFAISSNGFMGSNAKNPIMPNMTFKMRNYSNGNSRNLSMLHGLDQRIFNDPKYKLHLSQLEKICN